MFKISETALFNEDLQDKLGVTLILGRGRNPDHLRLEWASLQNASDEEILDAFDTKG